MWRLAVNGGWALGREVDEPEVGGLTERLALTGTPPPPADRPAGLAGEVRVK
jgi:hypothetical protein